MLERLIGWVSPRAAYERQAWRTARDELAQLGAGARSYEAAARGRKTADWRAGAGSGDFELIADLPTLRARSRQMIRDNSYCAAAARNLVANIVGTGIEVRPVHADPTVAAEAQAIFADVAAAPVDVEGRHDFYGVQKLAVRSMIEGGEALTNWRPEGDEPDRSVLMLEGDHLDAGQTRNLDNGGRVIAGVEFDAAGRRVAYHLFDRHPGDQLAYLSLTTRRVPAIDVDHMFEAVRISGQARGVPWFHAGLRRVRDVSDIEESVRIKKRVEACLAVFRKAADQGGSPLAERTAQESGPDFETLRPGMIIQGRPGESIEVVNPNSVGDGDAFLRSQLMAVAASFGLPYHVMTGDVSQANYSSLRASMVVFWALLDDWIYNTVVPQLCTPAFRRIMRREALRRNDRRLLQVRPEWTPPKRAWVDPLKDVAAEIAEVRAFGGMPDAFARRGRDYREALQEAADVAKLISDLGLALDSDPRRVNGSGGLQPAAGFLRPGGDAGSADDAA